jgi:beta-phosphoglucomutase-like phosphatase (HAD superfamily)
MRQVSDGVLSICDRYDAVLFDLDGVITNTASIHAACWKQMFDEYLQERGSRTGETLRSFDPVDDYRLYVDGKPRFDGVRDFLKSRGIDLPEGTPHDPPHAETVGGLGNRKNRLVTKAIEEKASNRTMAAFDSFASFAATVAKSLSFHRVRTARLSCRRPKWMACSRCGLMAPWSKRSTSPGNRPPIPS